MNQTLSEFKIQVIELQESFRHLMVEMLHSEIELEDWSGRETFICEGLGKARLKVYLDVSQDDDFRSIWLHVDAPSSYSGPHGRRHHKHHLGLFQEHQPKRKGAKIFDDVSDAMAAIESWLEKCEVEAMATI